MEQVTSRRRNSKLTIIINTLQKFHTSKSKYFLALHSCSESFGVAVKDIESPETKIKSKVFTIGRSLSNKLFTCIDIMLPRQFWKQISRISVAKGPGSFTSTRLTLSMARTISQQIDCSLDSLSSFHLMAPRLYKDLNNCNALNSFWIKDILPRRGTVAGKYKLIKIHKKSNYYEFNELITPQLIDNINDINPSINASNNIKKDIISLIEFSQFCHNLEIKNNWNQTLPIYPTSPIDNKKPINDNT
tara:strand:- start:1048 stop:1785 length:738 start_codon:yes stop_codon:yes gene_type:complete